MGGISIGIREFEFPQWVQDIYDCMTPQDREKGVKTNIYGCCNKKDEGYEIAPIICNLSNRVSILPEAKDVAIALTLADAHYPWVFLPGRTTKLHTCEICGAKFDTNLKDPKCESCGKYRWEKKT